MVAIYSVMLSDGNSSCGDVVFDKFNLAYRDEDSISDQNYEKHIFWNLYYENFLNLRVLEKLHIQRNTAHKSKELIKWGF